MWLITIGLFVNGRSHSSSIPNGYTNVCPFCFVRLFRVCVYQCIKDEICKVAFLYSTRCSFTVKKHMCFTKWNLFVIKKLEITYRLSRLVPSYFVKKVIKGKGRVKKFSDRLTTDDEIDLEQVYRLSQNWTWGALENKSDWANMTKLLGE